MKLATYTQQPSERYKRTAGYEEALDAGDTLASIALKSVEPSGLTVNNLANSTTAISWWANGGTDGTDYKATFTVTTAAGEIFEDEVFYKIREV